MAGELSVSAEYFSTFADVRYKDINDVNKTFGKDWNPYKYKTRVQVAKKVDAKKQQLLSKGILGRNPITTYICSQCSRQEFVPPVGEYIDKACSECVHLKNNFVKEQFTKVLNVAKRETIVPRSTTLFKELGEDCIYVILVTFVRTTMKCNQLGKKLIKHFDADPSFKTPYDARFRGHESNMFLEKFPILLSELKNWVKDDQSHKDLYNIFYQKILLRKLVSYSVRITGISLEDASTMKKIGRSLFKACCLGSLSITPSMWTFTNAAPVHCEQMLKRLGLGLGANTMEGREQKHQSIKKYARKTKPQDKWASIFRHEFTQGIYLPENGFDKVKFKNKSKQYIPQARDGHCQECCLLLSDGVCQWCDSPTIVKLKNDCEVLP